jgi:hypothetical protein
MGQTIALISIAGMLLLLISPLWVVSAIADQPDGQSPGGRAAQTVVGIGVILRAMARRLVQFGARGALRTAASAVLRAIARTLTRRLSRVLLRSAAGAATRGAFTLPSHLLPVIDLRRSRLSLLIGVIGLAASFGVAVQVSGEDTVRSLVEGFASPMWQMILLAALPMVAYAGFIHLAGVYYGATTRFATELDGILLQGYFTGGGSFLPMLTDMIIYGTPKERRQVAFASLASLYIAHLLLLAIALLSGSGIAQFASSMFLIYAFIYCFPIHPMEGRAVWNDSRGRWCLLFFPILFSFMLWFPEALLGVV